MAERMISSEGRKSCVKCVNECLPQCSRAGKELIEECKGEGGCADNRMPGRQSAHNCSLPWNCFALFL